VPNNTSKSASTSKSSKTAKSTKAIERDRRAKVEAMRREQQAREKRKSMLFIVLAIVVGVGLVAAATIPAYLSKRNDPANKSLASFGVSAAEASCTTPTNDAFDNAKDREHKPDGTTIHYATVPPSYGDHWASPIFPARPFYTAKDRPPMERLVHNLEHGYTVLWYDDTVKGDQLQELENLATSAREQDAVGPNKKFIVSAWDDAYGTLPEGKHIAMSHWGADKAHRMMCGQVSGEAVQNFISQFPSTDAPEPNAA
jgi:hypothetical protein